MTNYYTNEVREYAANANGCPLPLSSIKGPHTGLEDPTMAVVDRNGRIVVSNYLTGIVIFAPAARGDATPVAILKNSEIINAHLEGMTVGCQRTSNTGDLWKQNKTRNADRCGDRR